ncbi:MAG: 4-phosphoerythronate dehydrogenase [Cellvibrionaceae bacterium]
MKIVADENIPLIHEFFDSLGEVIAVAPRELSRAHTVDADILAVRSTVPIGRTLLEGTAVKYVGTCTAGVDHLDSKALEEMGIQWSGAPGCNANAVVDYVFSTFAALELDFLRCTVGIIGCGHVGGALYRRLTQLGVSCRCYDPLLKTEQLTAAQQADLTNLEAVLQADIVCIHAPLTKTGPHSSYHLLGAEQLAQLKPGATLISAGRGGVIDNAALRRGLEQRDDLRVVLDVWESEPDIDTALHERVTLGTPHIAGHSYDGKAKGTEIIYQNVCEFLQRPATKTFAQLDSFAPNHLIRLTHTDPLEAMREAILSVYDVRLDHQRLKQALQHKPDTRVAFDKLRKNYPMRREFSNYRIELPQFNEQVTTQLRAIGFQAVDAQGKDRETC